MKTHIIIAKGMRLRPLFCGCVSAYLGAWILNTAAGGGSWRLPFGVLSAVAAAVCVTARLLQSRKTKTKKKGQRKPSLLPLFAAVLLGCAVACVLTAAEDTKQARYDGMHGTEAEICGIVTGTVWTSDHGGCYTVYVTEMNGADAAFSITMETGRNLETGAGLHAAVRFCALGGDIRNLSLSRGIRLEAEGLDVSETEVSVPLPIRVRLWGAGIQQTLSAVLTDTLGETEGGLAAALLLGNRDALPDAVQRDFTRLGVAHILALSGMHLTTIVGFAGFLGNRLGRRWGRLCAAAAALCYMTVAGFSPAVTRAGTMLLLCLLLRSFGRSSDAFTDLGLAVCVILLCSPGASRDCSLLLSFWGVFGILLFTSARRAPFAANAPAGGRLRAAGRRLWSFVLATLCVILFLLPLTCMFFGKFSLLAPLSCLLFTPLALLLLWSLPIYLMLSPIPVLTPVLSSAMVLPLRLMVLLAGRLSALRGICISLAFPAAPPLTFAVFLALFWLLAAARGNRRLPLFCTLLAVAVLAGSIVSIRAGRRTQVTAALLNTDMDTWAEQSDGILVTSGEEALLIDISTGGYALLQTGSEAAAARQCTEIHTVLLTHLHTYHPASLERLWNREMVREIWMPNEDSDAARSILARAAAAGIRVVTYAPGDTLRFGEAEIQTYAYGVLDRSTHPVLRLDVTAAGERLVYLGSAYGEVLPFDEFSHVTSKVLWFGAHGPKYHQIPAVSVYSAAEAYFVTGDAHRITDPTPQASNNIVFGE